MSSLPPDHFLMSSTISRHAFSVLRSLAYVSDLDCGATFLK